MTNSVPPAGSGTADVSTVFNSIAGIGDPETKFNI